MKKQDFTSLADTSLCGSLGHALPRFGGEHPMEPREDEL